MTDLDRLSTADLFAALRSRIEGQVQRSERIRELEEELAAKEALLLRNEGIDEELAETKQRLATHEEIVHSATELVDEWTRFGPGLEFDLRLAALLDAVRRARSNT